MREKKEIFVYYEELAEKYGTPLKIMLPYIIEQRVEDLMDMFDDVIREYKYKGQFYYHYPKTFLRDWSLFLMKVGKILPNARSFLKELSRLFRSLFSKTIKVKFKSKISLNF